MTIRNATALAISALLLTTACSRNLEQDTYTSSNTVGKVVSGTVVSARQVTVKDTDQPGQNALGGIGGGALGGVAGSTLGGGKGKLLTTIGGVILGAVAGSAAQDQLGTQQGTEYVIRLDPTGQPATPTLKTQESVRVSRGTSVEDDIKSSIQTPVSTSEMISVVQADERPIQSGQRVLVIYHDDRPRVVPDTQPVPYGVTQPTMAAPVR